MKHFVLFAVCVTTCAGGFLRVPSSLKDGVKWELTSDEKLPLSRSQFGRGPGVYSAPVVPSVQKESFVPTVYKQPDVLSVHKKPVVPAVRKDPIVPAVRKQVGWVDHKPVTSHLPKVSTTGYKQPVAPTFYGQPLTSASYKPAVRKQPVAWVPKKVETGFGWTNPKISSGVAPPQVPSYKYYPGHY